MSLTPHVEILADGPVVRLTINRPETRNALSLQTVTELCDAIGHAGEDPTARVIVLTGAGTRAFASGADLNEMADALDTPESAARYDARFGAVYDALRSTRLPVIARIQAHAIGGGCLLAAACDVSVAAEGATFGVPAARIGLMLSPKEHALLVERVGPGRAKLLLFSGRRLTASEALAWGMLAMVVPPERLDDAVDHMAADIAAGAPLAITAAKRLVHASTSDAPHADAIAACYDDIYTSDDLREGLAAAKARRTPIFNGRRG